MDIQPSNQPTQNLPPQDNNINEPAPTIASPPITESPTLMKPTKRVRPVYWIILGAVVLLATAAVLYYFLVFAKPTTTSDESTNNQGSSIEKDSLNAAEVISLAKSKLTDAKVDKDNQEPPYIFEPEHKPSGYDFYTFASRSNGASKYVYTNGTATKVDTNLAALRQLLLDNQFKVTDAETYDYTVGGSEPATESGMVYESSAVVCLLNRVPMNENVADTVWLSCADKADYAQVAKDADPYYQALKTAGDNTDKVRLSVPTVKDSKTTGYKIAEGSISSYGAQSGAAVLYYQTPDSKWHYFRAGQDTPPCSDYNNDDLKKAFVGEPCYDDANDELSTVKL